MKNNFYKFYNLHLRKELLCKFNINNITSISEFESIELVIHLNNIVSVESDELIQSIKLLESLAGQKPKVQDLGSVRGVRGFSTGRKIKCMVTVRKNNMYNLLSYLIYIVFPVYLKRYGYLKFYNTGINTYNIDISDINVFYNLKSEIEFNNKLTIICKTTGKSNMLKTFLKSFYINIK